MSKQFSVELPMSHRGFNMNIEAMKRCVWSQYDDVHMPDTWKSDCGALWTFNEGSPKENGMKFCPSCGKPAVESAHGITGEQE